MVLYLIIGTILVQNYREIEGALANPVKAQIISTQIKKDIPQPPKEIKQMLDFYADKFGIEREIVYAIVKCESDYQADRLGDKVGGVATSFGLWQWHLVAHPEVSKKCALDAECSTVMAMMHIINGEAKAWTCFRREVLGENI
jgi:hypothetical protein